MNRFADYFFLFISIALVALALLMLWSAGTSFFNSLELGAPQGISRLFVAYIILGIFLLIFGTIFLIWSIRSLKETDDSKIGSDKLKKLKKNSKA